MVTQAAPSILGGSPFEFIREIGRGGMGVVVEARDRRTGEACAVKLLLSELAADPSIPDRMRLEAETISKSANPHFVGFRGAGLTAEGAPYYAMDILAGKNVREEMRHQGPFGLKNTLVHGIQTFDALAESHRLGVVHRDIKPENLFLCDGGEPRLLKVLDFGIAKVVEVTRSGPQPLAIPTKEGMLIGSLRWAAPEIINCADIDARTDIYSAGLVVWAMAAGTIAWPKLRAMEDLILAQLREPLPALEELLADPSYAALDRWIARATAKKATDRIPNARDAASELRKLLVEAFRLELPALGPGERPRLVAPGKAGPAKDQPAAAKRMVKVTLPRLAAGTQFEGRYKIVEHIGEGGMGTVYAAQQIFLKREVAIKLIPLEARAVHADLRQEFAFEMQVLAKLKHPNIVEIYDGGVTDDNVAYIVMERLHGAPLRHGLHGGARISDLRSCATLSQLAQALMGLHAASVLHRDVKPENVMIMPDGRAKLVDFGIARVRTKSKYATRNPNPMGTLHYMPREQLLNLELDESVDIYAFGLVMYECLTGVHPRATDSGSFQNRGETIVSVVEGKPLPSLAAARPDLPPFVHELYERAVDVTPSKRPTARDIVVSLAEFARWIQALAARRASPLKATDPMSPPAPAVRDLAEPAMKPEVAKGGTVPMARGSFRFSAPDAPDFNASQGVSEPANSEIKTDRDPEGTGYVSSPLDAKLLAAIAKPNLAVRADESVRRAVLEQRARDEARRAEHVGEERVAAQPIARAQRSSLALLVVVIVTVVAVGAVILFGLARGSAGPVSPVIPPPMPSIAPAADSAPSPATSIAPTSPTIMPAPSVASAASVRSTAIEPTATRSNPPAGVAPPASARPTKVIDTW